MTAHPVNNVFSSVYFVSTFQLLRVFCIFEWWKSCPKAHETKAVVKATITIIVIDWTLLKRPWDFRIWSDFPTGFAWRPFDVVVSKETTRRVTYNTVDRIDRQLWTSASTLGLQAQLEKFVRFEWLLSQFVRPSVTPGTKELTRRPWYGRETDRGVCPPDRRSLVLYSSFVSPTFEATSKRKNQEIRPVHRADWD
jgi:hypothetical protein